MATEHFCLRWNNHQSTLVSVFDNLLESGTLVDCTLAADGRYLKAHKVVLSACSPYLGMLLSQHYDKHPIIILKDVKFDELKAMLDYMYRGEVNISQEQLSTFLKAAETLQIKGLTDTGGEDGNGIHPNRPPSSNSTTSIPNDDPPSPGEGGSSPGPRKRKRNKHSDEPPDSEIQPKIGTGDASDRLPYREGVSISGTVVNTGSPSTKNTNIGNVKREPTETDGEGLMSVDDSGDSAMMSRPGPSSGGSTNNKNSPWLLSADSTAEEMQITPGQGVGEGWVRETVQYMQSRRNKPWLLCAGNRYFLNKESAKGTRYWTCVYKQKRAGNCKGTLAINRHKIVLSARAHTCHLTRILPQLQLNESCELPL